MPDGCGPGPFGELTATLPPGDAVPWLPKQPRDECGVFGIWGHPDAAHLAYYALIALQHRGQESAGIAALQDGRLRLHRAMGLVTDALPPEALARLTGRAAIGHVRYSTTGGSLPENAQPLLARLRGGELTVAHNGNLVNALKLRSELEDQGAIFQTTTDTEVVAHLIAREHLPLIDSIAHSLRRVRGGFAFAFLTPEGLFAARDPNGIRPLSLGVIRPGEGVAPTETPCYVVASESCAFDAVGAEFVRDVNPGELLCIDDRGLRSEPFAPAREPRLCIFEFVYFARPDSNLNGRNVHAVRKELGRQLAREHPCDADIVIGVPDSSLSAASGYAEEAGIPYEVGLIKNRYIGRTFIQPSHEQRVTAVRLKLNPLRKVVEGRRVVLVDDSIVRGTTSRHIVRLLRSAGAREVHLRISSPPYVHACHYGIDTSVEEELIANQMDLHEIERFVEADSLRYLSAEGMIAAVGGDVDLAGHPGENVLEECGSCHACFTGDYPVLVERHQGKYALEVLRP